VATWLDRHAMKADSGSPRFWTAAWCFAGALPAFAQTSPEQGTNLSTLPAAASTRPTIAAEYQPTSLEPDNPFALPRTPEGRPDFQGVVWHANHFAYLQGPPGTPLVISETAATAAFERTVAPLTNNPALALDPEIADLIAGIEGFPIVRGERRTRLLVLPADGRMPFTEAARKELATPALDVLGADNVEERTLLERCQIAGAELSPTATLAPLQNARRFIQTRDHVVIHSEFFDHARVIPFADAHPTNLPPSMDGNAIAHWDGDTLTIETIDLPERLRRRGPIPAFIVNPDAKIIERYSRISEDELIYQFTVEDPKIYSAPWLAEYSYFRAPFKMHPAACHEGNYGLANILRGQRVSDQRSGAKAAP
jgi:hypothetical protein